MRGRNGRKRRADVRTPKALKYPKALGPFQEETGLKITKVYGENDVISNQVGGVTTISFEPYCVTQNLSGAYSIILNTFLCEAEGNLLNHTNETQNKA